MLGLGLGLVSRGRPAAIVPWVPTDLGASLFAWWNADDTANGSIATWSSRKNVIATTAAAGLQPVSAAASLNGLTRGLTFDGVDDCFVSTSFAALPNGATPGEIWALASNSALGSIAAPTHIFRYGNSGVALGRSLHRIGITSVNRFQTGDGTTTLTDTVIDLSGPHIVGASFSGTTLTGRVDGRDTSPASAVIATLATATVRLRIGASIGSSASQFWAGVIRHIFVTAILSGTEREKLEGWMAWDSGLASLLPGGHPYQLAPP